MFKRLKRKFILINLLTTTIILVAAFSAIYISALNAANHRAERPFDFPPEHMEDKVFRDEMNQRIEQERKDSLQNLLISLIVSGCAIEIVIAFLSVYLAEQAIKPVRESYNAQKSFVANASHEIKTPLAVIQANLEAADIKGNHWLDNVSKKVEDLANLNNQLITLAKIDSLPKNQKIEQQEVDLSQLVRETADFYIPQLNKKSIKYNFKTENKKDQKVFLNKADFAQILNILLDNAVKYADKKVIVKIANKKVSIRNDGTVISEEDCKHIFDRFYQVNKASSGVGLGLAIAKQLAEVNHWNLSVMSDGKMTEFSIEL